jgi:hypothetical protein
MLLACLPIAGDDRGITREVERGVGWFVAQVAGGFNMAYRPPKGVRPPQLEGKRTGRPRGSKNLAAAWRDLLWGYEHRDEDRGKPPTAAAHLWWRFADYFPDEVEEFLQAWGVLPEDD